MQNFAKIPFNDQDATKLTGHLVTLTTKDNRTYKGKLKQNSDNKQTIKINKETIPYENILQLKIHIHAFGFMLAIGGWAEELQYQSSPELLAQALRKSKIIQTVDKFQDPTSIIVRYQSSSMDNRPTHRGKYVNITTVHQHNIDEWAEEIFQKTIDDSHKGHTFTCICVKERL
jgi:hypothetical protein